MKQHCEFGFRAISNAEEELGKSESFLKYAGEIAHCHHERWDGTGYPQGLSGTDIPLSARLMAVADVYDALISKRVYKPAFTHQQATAIIEEGRGSHFDPEITDAFLSISTYFQRIAQAYSDQENVNTGT